MVHDRGRRWTRRGALQLLLGTGPAGFLGGVRGARAEHRIWLLVAPFHGLYETARRIAPFVSWFEQLVGTTAIVHSAPDFRTFGERLLRFGGAFCTYALAPSHFVPLARQHGWRPVFDIVCGREIAFFGRKDADLAGVEDVARVRLMLPDPLSLVSLETLDYLQGRGLQPRRRLHLVGLANVIDAVERGMAEMGAVPRAFYVREEADEPAEEQVCRIVASFPALLRKTLLAHRRVDEATIQHLRRRAVEPSGRTPWLPILGEEVRPPSMTIYDRLERQYGTLLEDTFRFDDETLPRS